MTKSDESVKKHSLTFEMTDGKVWNTWNDFFLIPTSQPFVTPPPVQKMSVTVPGKDGELDFTEALDGTVHYENRTGSWEFIVDHDTWNEAYLNGSMENKYDFHYLWRTLMSALHGRQCYVTLDDDADGSGGYRGRIFISDIQSGSGYSSVTIEYNFLPFRYIQELNGNTVSYTKVGF